MGKRESRDRGLRDKETWWFIKGGDSTLPDKPHLPLFVLIEIVQLELGTNYGLADTANLPVVHAVECGRSCVLAHPVQLQDREVVLHEKLEHVTMDRSSAHVQSLELVQANSLLDLVQHQSVGQRPPPGNWASGKERGFA